MQVHGQHRNVLKWAFYSALGTLGSRFVGLAREVVMAALFGTGIVADAFSAAFRFPNVLRRVFGEGGLLVVFLPRYSQERIELGDEEANILASSVAVVLGIVMAVVILLGELTAPYLAWVFAHGWIDQPEKFALTVHLLRMLYPFVGFIAFATWAAAILNSHKKFFLPSLAPAFFNLGWLAGALVTLIRYREADPHLQATIVAAGVLFGGLLQFVVQLPMMKKIGFRFSPDVRRKWAAILEIGRLLLPALAAMAIVEINFMVDVFLASFLPQGSVAALTYANRLVYLPMGLASVAMAQATLPVLSDIHARGEAKKFSEMLSFSVRTIFGIMLPVSGYIIVMSTHIVQFLFERGSFSGTVSTPMTAFALYLYAVGLFAFGANKVLMQGFYALKDTRTPMMLSAVVVVINIIFNLLLIGPLKHGGLALGTSLASIVHLCLLAFFLRKRGVVQVAEYLKSFVRIAVVSVIVAALTKAISFGVDRVVVGSSFLDRTLQLFIPTIFWAVFVLAAGKIARVGEINQFLSLLIDKIRRIKG